MIHTATSPSTGIGSRRSRYAVALPQRRACSCILALVVPLLLGVRWVHAQSTSAEKLPSRFQYEQIQMGVTFRIVLYSDDENAANEAAAAAFARITQLNDLLSDYDPDSELSRLSATAGSGQAVPVSDDLWHVLNAAQHLSARSDGAFDVTIGQVVRLWRRARRQQARPSDERLEQALATAGHEHLLLDESQRTALLGRANMRLDLGGIAKGYAADEALRVLAAHSLTRAMVDGGGDLSIGDPPPDERGWRVAVAPARENVEPSHILAVSHCGVATSGDVYQFVEIDGERYSHIVDPRTALGLTTPMSVTVVAADGMTADSLASAVCVLGPERGIALVEDTDDAAALYAYRSGDSFEAVVSQRFPSLLATACATAE